MDLDVQIATTRHNVGVLNALFDQLETGVQAVNNIATLQTTAIWTDIDSCAQFATEYAKTLQALHTRLTTAWEKISEQARALGKATSMLVASDEESARAYGTSVMTEVDALMARADKGPTDLIAISALTSAVRALAGEDAAVTVASTAIANAAGAGDDETGAGTKVTD